MCGRSYRAATVRERVPVTSMLDSKGDPLAHARGSVLFFVSENAAAADSSAGVPSEIVDQSQPGIFHLPGPGFLLQLLVDLVSHAQSAGAERVPEALQASIGVGRQISLERIRARIDIVAALFPGH